MKLIPILVAAITLGPSTQATAGESDRHTSPRKTGAAAPNRAVADSPPAPDYVIGPGDIIEVAYWKDKDASAEVAVRPDGCVSLPLLNDVPASGLTPAELGERITKLASSFLEDPNVTVMVKQINSRTAYIVGEVARPGAYALTGPVRVLQVIAMAGGPTEFASLSDIAIVRSSAAGVVTLTFNYRNALKLKDLDQNILLAPGDTVIVR